MPPHPIDLPGDEPVLRSQLGGVGADQLVAAEAADQKLVVEPRAEPLRLGEAGERVLVGRRAHEVKHIRPLGRRGPLPRGLSSTRDHGTGLRMPSRIRITRRRRATVAGAVLVAVAAAAVAAYALGVVGGGENPLAA